jgi:putative ABC transport system permease protein
MFVNYLKTAFRNLLRHKVFSAINIVGLAVGMACTILILLWVQDELSFDRFHTNADRIYLVLRGDNNQPTAVTSARLGPALMQELPQVKNAGAFMKVPESFSVFMQHGDRGFQESICLADSSFFTLFSFRFVKGNPATALSDPRSVVITEETEKKYFGSTDGMGRIIAVSAFGTQSNVKVAGVLEDLPHNSHIQGRIFFSNRWPRAVGIPDYGWQNQSCQTYIQLQRPLKTDAEFRELASQIRACELRHDPNEPQSLNYALLPLTDIHLYGGNIKFLETAGDIKYVQVFSLIAIILLLIASINYMNLSTALSLRRTKEIGIKKALGANRKSLVLQFFGESLLHSFLALCFALLLVKLSLSEFNALSGKELAIRYIEPQFIALSLAIALLTGLISGSYPALFLSSFRPMQVLKGQLKLGVGSIFTRKGLVVLQFALSIIIIVCTIVVFRQLSFMRSSNLGLEKENLLCVKLVGAANGGYGVLRNELLKNPAIIDIARSEQVSAGSMGATLGVYWQGKPPKDETHFRLLQTDFDLPSVYKFELAQGRFFSPEYPTDSANAYVLNEAAVKAMGLVSPLNQEISVWGRNGKIIGVTKDFHFASFHAAIEPLIFRIPDRNEQNLYFSTMTIRFASHDPEDVISFVEKTWESQLSGIPFQFYFYDEFLNAQYKSEHTMSSLFSYFSFLSIFIACLGLFGLASLSAQQRTREVGIRKVLGASSWHMVVLLSREFLLWVAISNVIAFPVAWYAMHRWLEDFAYRTDIGWWVFAVAGGLSMVIAMLTVSTQAIKAALANPVEALRYE